MGRALNLFTTLDQAAARFGDSGAVYLGERCLVTWKQLRDKSLRLAASLRGSHGPGTRVAVASENRPEIVELFYAVWAAGCVVVPVNFKLHPREMAQILEDSGAAAVFASPKIGPNLAAVSPTPVEIIGSPEYESRFSAAPSEVPSTDPSSVAWLFYTSGTTGRSKGAMLSHRNLTAMTVAHLADIDSPTRTAAWCTRPRCHTARVSTSPRTCCAARARSCRPPGRSIPRNFWICARTIPVRVRSWRRR